MMRSALIILCSVFFSGCHGPDDWARNYAAGATKDSIDRAIQEEIRKDVPNGYKTKPYSRDVWNKYWNSRIYSLYKLEETPENKAYRGPSAGEFTHYIVETRRTNGLPEIVIEERNRDKIP